MKTVKILQFLKWRKKGEGNIAVHSNERKEKTGDSTSQAAGKRYKSNRELGRAGENRAAEYLDRKGYEIIVQNYRCRFGEIDIVAEKDEALCFIEVKTRSSMTHGAPCEAVDHRKRLHIRRCAWAFMEDVKKGRLHEQKEINKLYRKRETIFWLKNRKWESMKIEIVEVLYINDKFHFRHIQDVPL